MQPRQLTDTERARLVKLARDIAGWATQRVPGPVRPLLVTYIDSGVERVQRDDAAARQFLDELVALHGLLEQNRDLILGVPQ